MDLVRVARCTYIISNYIEIILIDVIFLGDGVRVNRVSPRFAYAPIFLFLSLPPSSFPFFYSRPRFGETTRISLATIVRRIRRSNSIRPIDSSRRIIVVRNATLPFALFPSI